MILDFSRSTIDLIRTSCKTEVKERLVTEKLEKRLETLEAEVRDLKDRNEIQELRFSYHIAVNEKQPESIKRLFAKNGGIDFAHLGTASGAELDKFYQHALSDLIPFVKQFIHNHSIQIDGDRGTGTSYLLATPVYNGESYLVSARFDDEYVKEDGHWKFKKMALIPFFMVPLSEGWAGEDKIKMGVKK